MSMPKQTNNLLNLSNQDLFIMKRKSANVSKVIITVGTRKFHFEDVDAYLLKGEDGLAFLSIPSVHAIFKGKDQVGEEGKVGALKALKSTKAPGAQAKSKGKSSAEVPEELAALLESFTKANNARIVPDNKGGYKVQKFLKPRKPKK